MSTTQALVLRNYGGSEQTVLSSIPLPVPGPGQVLVRVSAAGVNGLDWKVREGFVRDAYPLSLPAVLGIELAGVVVGAGSGAGRFQAGERVMGPLGGLGAYAGIVAVDEGNLCRIPSGLSDVQAAALPVAALAAWQSLHAAGPLVRGQRILIHGAAGALGSFAVQFAKRSGAFVIATARGERSDYLLDLGADEVIDTTRERFQDSVHEVHLILDYVGGDTQLALWTVLAKDGAMVATASPAILQSTPPGKRGLWFMMKPDQEQLALIASDLAQGRLRSTVGAVLPFADLPIAIEQIRLGGSSGKTVIDFSLSL